MRTGLATSLGILALVFWSMNVAITRVIGEAHHFGMPGLSFTLAGVVLLACDFFHKTPPPWRSTARKPYWFAGGLAFLAYMIFYVLGVSWSPDRRLALPLGLVNYLWPSLLLVMLPYFIACRMDRRLLAGGVVLCLSGVGLALLWGLDLGAILVMVREDWPAFFMMFACAVLWAFYSLAARKWGGNANGTGWFFLAAGFCLLGMWRFSGGDLHFTRAMIPPFLLHSLLATAAAYLMWDIGARRGDIGILGALANFLPLGSVLFGSWYLGEKNTPGLWIGCVLVTAGAVLSRRGVREEAGVLEQNREGEVHSERDRQLSQNASSGRV